MIKHKISRLLYYLKRYGLIRTTKKVILRLLKKEQNARKSNLELYENWIFHNEPKQTELIEQSKKRFELNPKISVVVPMFNTSETFFLELLNSLLAQTYTNWELCLADRKCSTK